MAKRVRLWASSWIAGATTCRPNSLAARSLAMPARRRVEARQPRAFGVARDRPALDVRQVVAEPAVALRERLRMGADRDDAFGRIGPAQQVVAHEQAGLADDDERRGQEQVERAGDHAFGRVLDRHHAEVGGAGAGGVEHLVDVGAGHLDDRRAEVAERRQLAEGAGRAEVGDPGRRLERAAGRHDLAPDRRHAVGRQRAGVAAPSGRRSRRLRARGGRPASRRRFLSSPIARAMPARRFSSASSSRSTASICSRRTPISCSRPGAFAAMARRRPGA